MNDSTHNFKYNIGDLIKLSDDSIYLALAAGPDKKYHDNLRVVFRFYDGQLAYVVEAEAGICFVVPEKDAELVERYVQPEQPSPDSETKPVSKDERFNEIVTFLDGKIRELEQKLSAEQQKNRKQREDIAEFLRKSEACLDAVTAMLECSGGATHRMRDFYASAMMKFIESVKSQLRCTADIPF